MEVTLARVAPVYTSFSRGEVSPLMFGRVDIEQYPTLLEKCRNCWVRPYGTVSRVAGSEYINSTKNNAKARLIKFVFSPTDSYIIEVEIRKGVYFMKAMKNLFAILEKEAIFLAI